ncbi:hypothetical protein KGM_214341B, partial [Danaus plexippus plexippus]
LNLSLLCKPPRRGSSVCDIKRPLGVLVCTICRLAIAETWSTHYYEALYRELLVTTEFQCITVTNWDPMRSVLRLNHFEMFTTIQFSTTKLKHFTTAREFLLNYLVVSYLVEQRPVNAGNSFWLSVQTTIVYETEWYIYIVFLSVSGEMRPRLRELDHNRSLGLGLGPTFPGRKFIEASLDITIFSNDQIKVLNINLFSYYVNAAPSDQKVNLKRLQNLMRNENFFDNFSDSSIHHTKHQEVADGI